MREGRKERKKGGRKEGKQSSVKQTNVLG